MNSQGRSLALDYDDLCSFWTFYESGPVDEYGRPIVLYHGTDADFSEFRTIGNDGQGEAFVLDGAFFSDNPAAAAEFGSHKDGTHVIPAYVSLQNPLNVEMYDDGEGIECDWRNPMSEQDMIEAARDAGHDGVVFASSLTGERYFVAFRPEQIKSAIGNPGTYCREQACITDGHGFMPESDLAEQNENLPSARKFRP